MDVKCDNMLLRLTKFYNQRGTIDKIVPVVNCMSNVSLRLLDWFVTNYSKKKNIIIPLQKHGPDATPTFFNVYLSYRAQLKAYSKQYFDPFRRRDRINYYYAEDKYIETTIGQLNFFRWVIENDVLEYIDSHAQDIEADMMLCKTRQNRKGSAKDKEVDNGNDTTETQEQTQTQTHTHTHTQAERGQCSGRNYGRSLSFTSDRNHCQWTDEQKEKDHEAGKKTGAKRSEITKGRVNHINHITGTLTVRFD